MKANRQNILILFFTMVVVMLGFGMIIPIMPFYVESFGAGGSALGMLMATYGVMQFAFAPVWGGISDRYGRKPILLIGVMGNALAQLFMGLSTELWMLFAARALAGILSSATLPTVMAYIGDSTEEENRSGGMGVIGAAMGVGMVLGPGLGGWLASGSLSLPFYLAAVLSLLAFFLILVILPEPPKFKPTSRNISGPQLRQMWDALTGPLGILFILAFLLSFGISNLEAVFGLYSLYKYAYGPEQVGAILTVVGVISALIQGVLVGPLSRRWGEVVLIRLAFLSSAVGFILMILASSDPQVWLAVSFFITSNAMLNPLVASLISKRALTGQGISMGLNNSFLSLGRIAGPIWAGVTFDRNINLPYLSGAVVMLVGFAVTLFGLARSAVVPASTESPPSLD